MLKKKKKTKTTLNFSCTAILESASQLIRFKKGGQEVHCCKSQEAHKNLKFDKRYTSVLFPQPILSS